MQETKRVNKLFKQKKESPQKESPQRHSKNNIFKNQLQTIFLYLQENIATASMVSEITGIPQKNICRYKRDLELNGYLWEIEKKLCKKTGFKAWYLTTNPENAPISCTQLNLFCNE